MHYIRLKKVLKLNTVFKNKKTQCICMNMNIYKKELVILHRIIAQDGGSRNVKQCKRCLLCYIES